MDAYVIQVLSRRRSSPTCNGDLRLVDCEDGDMAEITVSAPLLKRYQQTLAAFVAGAQDFCTRRGMGYLLGAATNAGRPNGVQATCASGAGALMWPAVVQHAVARGNGA